MCYLVVVKRKSKLEAGNLRKTMAVYNNGEKKKKESLVLNQDLNLCLIRYVTSKLLDLIKLSI